MATVHKAMLLATVLLLGGPVACGSGGTEGSPTGVSDEESIRDVVEQSFDALRTLDDSDSIDLVREGGAWKVC